jgi:hypothetical protein
VIDSFLCGDNSSLFHIELISLCTPERTVLPHVWINYARIWSVPGGFISNSEVLGSDTVTLAVCILVWQLSLIPCTFSTDRSDSHFQNTLGVWKYMTLLFLCYISSRLVTVRTYVFSSYEFVHTHVLTVCFKLMIFTFQMFHFVFPTCLQVLQLLFRLSGLIWLGSSNHCNLPCSFDPKILSMHNEALVYSASMCNDVGCEQVKKNLGCL